MSQSSSHPCCGVFGFLACGLQTLSQALPLIPASKACGDARLASSLREELQELCSDHLGAAWAKRVRVQMGTGPILHSGIVYS